MTDNFNGDTPHLIRCIEALLNLDAKGALAPHGIGGHARTLLEAAAVRLATGAAALPDPLREALHLIASTTTDPGAREEAQHALGVLASPEPKGNRCGCNHWTTPKCPARDCPWQGKRPVDAGVPPSHGGRDAG